MQQFLPSPSTDLQMSLVLGARASVPAKAPGWRIVAWVSLCTKITEKPSKSAAVTLHTACCGKVKH